jgi:hypothetical protein
MTSAPRTVDRRELEDERDFLLCSLRDLDLERDAGDLSEADYRALRDRYTERAAAVLRALATFGAGVPDAGAGTADGATGAADGATGTGERVATTEAGSGRRRRRRVVAVGLGAVFVVGAVVGLVTVTTGRLPGETASGSPTLGPAQEVQRQLAQAAVLETTGRPLEALRLYRQILARDPAQAQALAESGWLEFQAGVESGRAGVVRLGQSQEQAAVRADPGAYGPHLYLGSMLLVEGDATAAVGEFRTYLAADPPVTSRRGAAPFITRAFTESGLTPPALPGP